MKSAENRSRNDDAMQGWLARHRRFKLQGAVRSVTVEVAQELGEQGDQMPLVQHDDVVKALLAYGPNYPLRDRIRQRRPVGCLDVFDPMTSELAPEVTTVSTVPIMDQVSRLPAPGGDFDNLPPDPGRRRAGGDVGGDVE